MVGTGATVGSLSAPERPHLKHIEGLRATAALIVYVNHAFAQCWNPYQKQAPTGILSLFSYSRIAGHLSVTVFIVISGFCLAMPLLAAGGQLRGGALTFFKRRARRILPPYYGALAFCLVLIGTVLGEPSGTLWDVPILVNRDAIIAHALLLQDLFGTGSINYVFWSIAVEWHIYFLFPLFVWSFRRYGAATTVIASMLVGYAVRFGAEGTRLVRAQPQYIGMFTLGMLAAYVAQSPREPYVTAQKRFPWGVVGAVSLVVACVLTSQWGIALSTERFHLLDFPVGIMATCLLVLSSRKGGTLGRALSFKPLAFVGTFSYSLYLIHAPLLQLMWKYILVPAGLSPTAMFAFLLTVGLAITFGTAYGFYLVLEAPFLRKAPRPVPALESAA